MKCSNYSENSTIAQRKALAITPKFSAFLSVVGSVSIVYRFLFGDYSEKLNLSYNRLLLMLSISDLISSFAGYFISTWAIPGNDPNVQDMVWGNIGNQLSCDIQGFMYVAATGSSIFYTASLSLYFLLFIRYSWSEEKIRRVEPLFHLTSICYPTTMSILNLYDETYNPTAVLCFPSLYPPGCTDDCTRGKVKYPESTYIILASIVLPFGTIIVSMASIVCFVWKREQRSSRHSSRWGHRNVRTSKLVLWKAFRYIGAFFVVWMPYIFNSYFFLNECVNFGAMMVLVILNPLQGFFNAFVYHNGTNIPFSRLTASSRQVSFSLRNFRNSSSAARRASSPIDTDSEESTRVGWEYVIKCCCLGMNKVSLSEANNYNQHNEHFVEDVDTLFERKRRSLTVHRANNVDVENNCSRPDGMMSSSGRLSNSVKERLAADIGEQQEANGMDVPQDANNVDILKEKKLLPSCSTGKDLSCNDNLSFDNSDDTVKECFSLSQEKSLTTITKEEPKETCNLDIQYPVAEVDCPIGPKQGVSPITHADNVKLEDKCSNDYSHKLKVSGVTSICNEAETAAKCEETNVHPGGLQACPDAEVHDYFLPDQSIGDEQ